MVNQVNSLAVERQKIITEALQPFERQLDDLTTRRELLLQDALRIDGEVRLLEKLAREDKKER